MAAINPALTAIEEAVDRMRAAKGRVTGVLRVNVPRVALPMAITAVMAEMARRYPDLTIEITADDGLVDIVSGGFDAGIRLGDMIAEDMIAIRLTPPFKAIIVAAPSYLDTKGQPRTIADLRDHNCIGFRQVSMGSVYAWELTEKGADLAVHVSGPPAPSAGCRLIASACPNAGQRLSPLPDTANPRDRHGPPSMSVDVKRIKDSCAA